MTARIVLAASLLLLGRGGTAQSLREKLAAAEVPLDRFTAAELASGITSYAVSVDPYIIAYYEDHGSEVLQGPLHIIQYSRKTKKLWRAEVTSAPPGCREAGAVMRIRAQGDFIYVDTHLGPSAGCLLVLGSDLSIKAGLAGWLRATIASDYAIIEQNEIHFQAISPLHLAAYDLWHARLLPLYPPEGDAFRQQYSDSLRKYLSLDWCRIHNAPCDPENFDVLAPAAVTVNESARVFGFQTEFDSDGFGDAAAVHVAKRSVVYVYREHQGVWEHREFDPPELPRRFGIGTVEELVLYKPSAAFQ